jgi:hypothetical protein
MNVRLLQCPACGSALEAGPVGGTMACGYCGARLEVTQGVSGAPLAKLAEIKIDTSYLAKERAYERLAGNCAEIEGKYEALRADREARLRQSANSELWIKLAFFVLVATWILVGAIVGSGATGFVAGLLAGIGLFVYSLWREASRQAEIEREYQEPLQALLEEHSQAKADADRLKQELDRLAREM